MAFTKRSSGGCGRTEVQTVRLQAYPFRGPVIVARGRPIFGRRVGQEIPLPTLSPVSMRATFADDSGIENLESMISNVTVSVTHGSASKKWNESDDDLSLFPPLCVYVSARCCCCSYYHTINFVIIVVNDTDVIIIGIVFSHDEFSAISLTRKRKRERDWNAFL